MVRYSVASSTVAAPVRKLWVEKFSGTLAFPAEVPGNPNIGWSCASGTNCLKSCQWKRDSISYLIVNTGHMLSRKGELWQAAARSKLRNNLIKLGALAVLAFRIWTTTSLRLAPHVAQDMGSNDDWEELLISNRLLLLRRRQRTFKPVIL